MVIATFISSFCIGLLFFFIDLIFSYSSNWSFFVMMVAFFISLIIISFFGIPTVILLKKFNRLNWPAILTSGFAIAFLINLFLSLIFSPSCDNCSSSVNGQILMENGAITAIGWIQSVKNSVIQGLLGMVASAIFYKVLLMRTKIEIKNP